LLVLGGTLTFFGSLGGDITQLVVYGVH
jgi:hypothetical protein